MFDHASKAKFAVALGPAALDADNTPAALDRQGYESLTLAIAVGVGGITFTSTNKVEFKWTHSDDGTTYTAVVAADIVGEPTVGDGGIVKSLTAAHAAAAVYKYGYKGSKRYHKLLADFGGTHAAATPLAAVWELGHPHVAPVA